MSEQKIRLWRYEVDEVWGWEGSAQEAPVKIGTVLIDKWKSDRTWNVYDFGEHPGEYVGGWHCKLLGEAEPEVVEKVLAKREAR